MITELEYWINDDQYLKTWTVENSDNTFTTTTLNQYGNIGNLAKAWLEGHKADKETFYKELLEDYPDLTLQDAQKNLKDN